jgi:hypothetical protein
VHFFTKLRILICSKLNKIKIKYIVFPSFYEIYSKKIPVFWKNDSWRLQHVIKVLFPTQVAFSFPFCKDTDMINLLRK